MQPKRMTVTLVAGALAVSVVIADAQPVSRDSSERVAVSSSTKIDSAATQPKLQDLQQRAALINRFTDKFQADAAAQAGGTFNAQEWKRELGMRLMYQPVDSLTVALTAPNLAMAQNELFNATKPNAKHATSNNWAINFLSSPCRIVDTRSGGGGQLGPAWRSWIASTATNSVIAGQGGNAGGCGNFPNADGFLLYVTVVPSGPGGPDFLTVQDNNFPTPPGTSTMNYYAQNIANFAVVACNGCGGGDGGFFAYASRNTNVVVDLLAWTGTLGPVALDCTTVTSTASFLGAVAASCGAGYALSGGGCQSSSVYDHAYSAYPSSSTTFTCGFWPESGQTIGSTLTASAICCRVPGL